MNLSRASADGVIQEAFNEHLAKTTSGVCLHGYRAHNRKRKKKRKCNKSGVFSLTITNGAKVVKMKEI